MSSHARLLKHCPTQSPDASHVALMTYELPGSQGVPAGSLASTGQSTLLGSHTSAWSHGLSNAAGRHTVERYCVAAHVSETPSHLQHTRVSVRVRTDDAQCLPLTLLTDRTRQQLGDTHSWHFVSTDAHHSTRSPRAHARTHHVAGALR
jgi:hypothetical protein